MPRPLLIPFALLPGWVGMAYLLGDPSRTNTPSFEPAKALLLGVADGPLTPMQLWGLLFLSGSALLGFSILSGHPDWIRWALWAVAGTWVWWALVLGDAPINDPHASLNGPAVYGFVAFTYFLAAWRVTVNPYRRTP